MFASQAHAVRCRRVTRRGSRNNIARQEIKQNRSKAVARGLVSCHTVLTSTLNR